MVVVLMMLLMMMMMKKDTAVMMQIECCVKYMRINYYLLYRKRKKVSE